MKQVPPPFQPQQGIVVGDDLGGDEAALEVAQRLEPVGTVQQKVFTGIGNMRAYDRIFDNPGESDAVPELQDAPGFVMLMKKDLSYPDDLEIGEFTLLNQSFSECAHGC